MVGDTQGGLIYRISFPLEINRGQSGGGLE